MFISMLGPIFVCVNHGDWLVTMGRSPLLYGQFSKFHVCFCGLDPGNLKFETVRTNKQHICFEDLRRSIWKFAILNYENWPYWPSAAGHSASRWSNGSPTRAWQEVPCQHVGRPLRESEFVAFPRMSRCRTQEQILFREFRDVVFEDVVFDNNSSVTPY